MCCVALTDEWAQGDFFRGVTLSDPDIEGVWAARVAPDAHVDLTCVEAFFCVVAGMAFHLGGCASLQSEAEAFLPQLGERVVVSGLSPSRNRARAAAVEVCDSGGARFGR